MSPTLSLSQDFKLAPERTLADLIEAGRLQLREDAEREEAMARNKAVAVQRKKKNLLQAASAYFPAVTREYLSLEGYAYRPDGSVFYHVLLNAPNCAPVLVAFESDEEDRIQISRTRVSGMRYESVEPNAAPYVVDGDVRVENIEKALALAAEIGEKRAAASSHRAI